MSLYFAYNYSKRIALSTTFLNKEITIILNKIKEKLKYEKNLTLVVDGWCDESRVPNRLTKFSISDGIIIHFLY
ncbi:hypothetical protein GLOIN_2v1788481 [Rhizophagus irregularis DAOM 181602=DAOM 197198]|uniref:DUF659 domain-containing protein n=1 Tax=Rhizophagus irregularis (strain DAOM 181602 / DAOM 197198 / MUCL 43194) TaxID=747089 RepID=A0A2P4P3L7_RHIID|nr:hypothetical protein GLOIN_2v1788481 [Rhizophagus irregularis DAOM 181602=DAOM 197198]POG59965.1 hypothetical protein GLOIN_2v1788481 [Rhizophagus irregularis DAOM 181602=DAOM 197198]|eukprot:XP_025166831.1 hypothetical protein GLOIN_2v1788481 [Rhizophagus irregularis DAOM 181602=DAOM 197198]